MQRKPKSQTKKANALTSAQAEFVSIVKTGANMMPFRTLKSEDTPENTMQLTTKAATHDIAKLVFKGDAFSEEVAVQSWLVAGGYEGVTIVKEEDGTFTVTDPAAPIDGLVEIETDGVTAFIFKKAVAAAKDAATAAEVPNPEALPSVVTTEGVQPVAKTEDGSQPTAVADVPSATTDIPVVKEGEQAPAVTAGAAAPEAAPAVATAAASPVVLGTPLLETLSLKFDSWDVEYSDEVTLSGTLADGYDGVPPGFNEVIGAMYVACRNAVIMGQVDSLSTIFGDAAALVQKLVALFPADVPFVLDPTVFLEDEKLSAYVQKAEDGTVTLDEVKLRGDMFFPDLTFTSTPLLLSAQKATPEEVQKRDMTNKRKKIQAAAAAKAKPNAQVDSTGNTAAATKSDTSETGSAAPEVTEGALTAALTAALAPVLSQVQTLTVKFDEREKEHAAEIERLKAESAEAIKGVTAQLVERQTRKSAEPDECVTGNTKTTKDEKQARATKSVSDMRLRGALGMPSRAR